jgi:hypothetical protein
MQKHAKMCSLACSIKSHSVLLHFASALYPGLRTVVLLRDSWKRYVFWGRTVRISGSATSKGTTLYTRQSRRGAKTSCAGFWLRDPTQSTLLTTMVAVRCISLPSTTTWRCARCVRYSVASNNRHCRGISGLSVIGVFISWGSSSDYPVRLKGHPWLTFSTSLAFRAAVRAPALVIIAVANCFG